MAQVSKPKQQQQEKQAAKQNKSKGTNQAADKSAKQDPTENKIVRIGLRANYFQDHITLIRVIIALQAAIVVALLFFVSLKIKDKPNFIIFNTTENGQLIKPNALDTPSMNTAQMLNWVTEAVMSAYSFNYLNINNQMDKLSEYFDDRAFQDYVTSLQRDKFVQDVGRERLIVSASAEEAPELKREEVSADGRYIWEIELPVRVVYQNKIVSKRQKLEVRVVVMRVPETESPLGIKIIRFLAISKGTF